MRRSATLPLALSATTLAALVPAVWQRHVVCAMAPVACGTSAFLWSLACAIPLAVGFCLLTLALWRALGSVRLQRARTAEALQPLLTLPAVTPPADLATLLRTLRLEGRTTLIACTAPVALCHGLRRPRLLLSTGAVRGLSVAEVEVVLRHECAHLRRRDPLRLVAARALAAALPAVPLLGAFAATLPAAQELAADRAVLTAIGADALAGALLKVGDAGGALRGPLVAVGAFSDAELGGALRGPLVAVGAFSDAELADARIGQLLGEPVPRLSPSPRTLLAASATLGLVATLAALVPLLWCMVLAPALMGIAAGRRPTGGREPR